jgi:RNA polymerase sigma factor (TIGR02999 family)
MLLEKWSDGHSDAQDDLMPIVYGELRKMAKRYLRGEKSGHTFQTTDLIHEAYLRLAGSEDKDWKNRHHFYCVAAGAMRHILVDYARAKARKKRGGPANRVELNEAAVVSVESTDELIALDEALKDLSVFDERKSKVVELKYFGGLTITEIADFLNVSQITVKRDWQFARSWLLKELASK